MDNDLPAGAANGTPGPSIVNTDDTNKDPNTPCNDADPTTPCISNILSTNSTEACSSSATEETIITITTISKPDAQSLPSRIQEPSNYHDSDGIFKLPDTPRGKKRLFQSIDNLNSIEIKEIMPESSKKVDVSFDEPEPPNKVSIYTKDTGPQWYEVHENIQNISKTIVPSRLPAAFNLPFFGRPEFKSDLESFYEQKSREFFEGDSCDHTLADAHDEAERSVEACIAKISSTLVPVQICIPLAGTTDEIMVEEPKKRHEDDLMINNMYRFRKEKDVNNMFTKKFKYRGIRLMPLLKEDEKPEGPMLSPGKDIMFRVRIYRPFPYSKQKAQYRGRHSVFSRDLILIGRHKLTELRDSFVCANDVDMRLDISERINDMRSTTAKDLFPSGFLFINNVFYVDKRKGCHDISERIREWAVARGIGKFPCKDMSSVTIDQLNIRLGHPEVYVHQGNCEHLFTFSEIRLLNACDPLNLSHYSCHTAVSQNQTVYCTACAEFGAKFIVTGCSSVPFDPAFFCDTCLKLYLYKTGKKTDDFKAYSFRGNEIHSLKPQG